MFNPACTTSPHVGTWPCNLSSAQRGAQGGGWGTESEDEKKEMGKKHDTEEDKSLKIESDKREYV